MAQTIEELKALREELVERRRSEVYLIGGAHDDGRIAKAVQVHLAIEAIDAVIAGGKGAPELSESPISFL
ncbi:hypothetical protein [Ancylobacter terrae]|uniref:hypothetical protein n=1 Tax=Ancylobacter sp. sgz301288 TaxID=3342077 RepID=UPI00385EE09F